MSKYDEITFFLSGIVAPYVFALVYAFVFLFLIGLGGSEVGSLVLGVVVGLLLGTKINSYEIKKYKRKGGILSARKLNIVAFIWWLFSAALVFTFFYNILS